MKCIILFAYVILITAEHLSPCDDQYEHLVEAYSNCTAGDFSEIKLQEQLYQLADGKITENEFEELIVGTCPLFHTTIVCRVEYKAHIKDECLGEERFQKNINLQEFLLTVVMNLCANNAEGYKGVVESDGAACLMKNEPHMACINATEPHIDINSPELYSDANICLFVKKMVTCLPHYDHCENKFVKERFSEINLKFKEQFHCEFELES